MHPSFVSIIALQNWWAAAMEAGEVSTAQRESSFFPLKIRLQLLRLPWLLPRGGLCSLCVLPECQCPQGTCSAAVTWVTLSLPRSNSAWSSNIHTCKCLWNSFLLGDDCLGQSWRPLMMNSREKWASLGMVVKIMISSFSGEAMLTKLK